MRSYILTFILQLLFSFLEFIIPRTASYFVFDKNLSSLPLPSLTNLNTLTHLGKLFLNSVVLLASI